MSRYLLCTSTTRQFQSKYTVSDPDGQRFLIREGETGVTPINRQADSVNQETAEWLVANRPGWEIVDQKEIDELEKLL
jgi:hypothetical protein